MKKWFLLGALALWLTLPGAAQAQGAQVTAHGPDFPVKVMGFALGAETADYPLLVYRDITYWPMTYDNSRLLGLASSWQRETGLVITADPAAQSAEGRTVVRPPLGQRQTYQAALVDGPVTVLGQTIDNSREEYPLLTYRDVVYFPLTWRWLAETFGCFYQFNGQAALYGLSIDQGLVIDARVDVVEKTGGDYTVRIYYDRGDGELHQNLLVQKGDGPFEPRGRLRDIYGYDVTRGYDGGHGLDVSGHWARQSDVAIQGDWLLINSNTSRAPRVTGSTPCRINLLTNEIVYLNDDGSAMTGLYFDQQGNLRQHMAEGEDPYIL